MMPSVMALDSLVDIEVLPIPLIIPSHRWWTQRVSASMCKSRDQVCCLHYTLWVQEPKCLRVSMWNKTYVIQALWSPPRLVSWISPKPMDPQELHSLRRGPPTGCTLYHLHMKHTKHSCIPKWVVLCVFILIREDHYVTL